MCAVGNEERVRPDGACARVVGWRRGDPRPSTSRERKDREGSVVFLCPRAAPLLRSLAKPRFEERAPSLSLLGLHRKVRLALSVLQCRPKIILRRILIFLLEECPQPHLFSPQHLQVVHLLQLMRMQGLLIQALILLDQHEAYCLYSWTSGHYIFLLVLGFLLLP